MKTLNYAKILLLMVTILGMTSCDKYYDDEYLRNSDNKLCGYNWWYYYPTTEGGRAAWCTLTLRFEKNGRGREVYEYQRDQGGEIYKTITNNFSWEWINNMEGLVMITDGVDNIYFDNVWVRDYYLSGVYDGENITFLR